MNQKEKMKEIMELLAKKDLKVVPKNSWIEEQLSFFSGVDVSNTLSLLRAINVIDEYNFINWVQWDLTQNPKNVN